MFKKHPLFLLLFLHFIFPHFSWSEMRTFTDALGREIQAELIKSDGTEVTMKRQDGLVFSIAISKLSEADQNFIATWKESQPSEPNGDDAQKNSGLDERIKPGNTFMLDFPDLPKVGKGEMAGCEVSIPEEYKADEPVPLFVWIQGGTGSKKIKGAGGMVAKKKYVIVALPIAKGVSPVKHHGSAKKMEKIWKVQSPMLEKVFELIPNIDPKKCIVAGTSNGAHVIGTGLDQKWKGFYDRFTAFIMHEGGANPSNKFKGARRKKVLVMWGADTPHMGWQKGFNAAIDKSKARLTMEEIPDAKHGLTREGRQVMKEWINKL